MDTQDLIIKDFDTAIASSPYKGHALMRNIDIDKFPGSMRANNKTLNTVVGCQTATFYVDTANDYLNIAATTLDTQSNLDAGVNYNYVAVTLSTTGSLPGGLATNTTYFLIRVGNNTCRIATSFANAKNGVYIDITSDGTGVHTITPVPIGTINHIRANKLKISIPETTVATFALDSNGRVWFSEGSLTAPFYLLTGNSIGSNAHGNGLEIFYTSDLSAVYLFVFMDDQISVINVTAQSNIYTPSWTNGWQTLNTPAGLALRHECLLGQDNIIYFGDSRYVGSIMEKAGSVFNPASSATYTYNNQALSLPNNEYAYCLSELNLNLLVGGARSNKIYPWDRVSVSYNMPILVPEIGIYGMANVGNVVVILAGQYGNIYKTQGSYVTQLASIPSYIINNTDSTNYNLMSWGGMAVRNGKVLVGASFVYNSSASGMYQIHMDGRITQDQTPYGGAQQVTAIYSVSEYGFLMGYAGGIDKLNFNKSTVGSYYAVFQSELYNVSDYTSKKKFSQFEVQTGRGTGGYIRASYRTSLSDSFTTLATFLVPSAGSGKVSFNTDIGLTDLENIQIQVEFDYSIEIRQIALYS